MKNNLYRNGRNGSSVGFFLTLFDNNLDCQIDEIGSRAQVFWIWQTKKCTPIYLNGQFTHEYYKLNGSNFQLMCEDSECTNCRLVCVFLGTIFGILLGTLSGTLLGTIYAWILQIVQSVIFMRKFKLPTQVWRFRIYQFQVRVFRIKIVIIKDDYLGFISTSRMSLISGNVFLWS